MMLTKHNSSLYCEETCAICNLECEMTKSMLEKVVSNLYFMHT